MAFVYRNTVSTERRPNGSRRPSALTAIAKWPKNPGPGRNSRPSPARLAWPPNSNSVVSCTTRTRACSLARPPRGRLQVRLEDLLGRHAVVAKEPVRRLQLGLVQRMRKADGRPLGQAVGQQAQAATESPIAEVGALELRGKHWDQRLALGLRPPRPDHKFARRGSRPSSLEAGGRPSGGRAVHRVRHSAVHSAAERPAAARAAASSPGSPSSATAALSSAASSSIADARAMRR